MWNPPSAQPERSLWRCQRCIRDFTVPVDWKPHGCSKWTVSLRCSNCSASSTVIASRDELAALRQRIDSDRSRLLRTAERLTTKRRSREIAVFAIALQRDLICADDFAS